MSPDQLGSEELFEILSNQRRRYAIHYLYQQGKDATLDVSEVARQVAAWEYDVQPESVTTDQRRSVYNTLNQTHLPLLEEADIIQYDSRSKEVRLTAPISVFQPYTHANISYIPSGWLLITVAMMNLLVPALVLFITNITGLIAATLFIPSFVLVLICVIYVYQAKQTRLGTSGPPPELQDKW